MPSSQQGQIGSRCLCSGALLRRPLMPQEMQV
jgi:hypothetical protein